MAYTSHGHHIPGTPTDDKTRRVARCSAFMGCRVCQADKEQAIQKQTEEMLSPRVQQAIQRSPIDDLFDEFAERLQKVYDDRSAGDYSFHGILSEFLTKISQNPELMALLVERHRRFHPQDDRSEVEKLFDRFFDIPRVRL